MQNACEPDGLKITHTSSDVAQRTYSRGRKLYSMTTVVIAERTPVNGLILHVTTCLSVSIESASSLKRYHHVGLYTALLVISSEQPLWDR